MKALYIIMAFLTVLYVLPVACSGDHEINGSSRKAAYKSAIKVKRYLPTDDRILFDFSFGILEEIKTAEGGTGAFLKAVGGLRPEEVIELAKKEVNAKIAAHDSKFAAYQSWDDMVKKLTASADKPLRQTEADERQRINTDRQLFSR